LTSKKTNIIGMLTVEVGSGDRCLAACENKLMLFLSFKF